MEKRFKMRKILEKGKIMPTAVAVEIEEDLETVDFARFEAERQRIRAELKETIAAIDNGTMKLYSPEEYAANRKEFWRKMKEKYAASSH